MIQKCDDRCGSCSAKGCSDRKAGPVTVQLEESHGQIRKVIAVVSGKGGVGKSLVTSLLAVAAQRQGYRVGILDADITGPSIPKAFGVRGQVRGNGEGMLPLHSLYGIKVMSINLLLDNETEPVVWRGPMIANTVKQFYTDTVWEHLDYLFIDMPPGTGDVPLTVFQSLKVDGIVMVTTPQDLVSMVVEKAVHMARRMEVPILGLVENMSYFVCDQCDAKHYLYGNSELQSLADNMGIPLLAQLPMSKEFAALCDRGAIEEVEGTWFEKVVHQL